MVSLSALTNQDLGLRGRRTSLKKPTLDTPFSLYRRELTREDINSFDQEGEAGNHSPTIKTHVWTDDILRPAEGDVKWRRKGATTSRPSQNDNQEESDPTSPTTDSQEPHEIMGGSQQVDIERHLFQAQTDLREAESSIRKLVVERDKALNKAAKYKEERDRAIKDRNAGVAIANKERDKALEERDTAIRDNLSTNPFRRLLEAAANEEVDIIGPWAKELLEKEAHAE